MDETGVTLKGKWVETGAEAGGSQVKARCEGHNML